MARTKGAKNKVKANSTPEERIKNLKEEIEKLKATLKEKQSELSVLEEEMKKAQLYEAYKKSGKSIDDILGIISENIDHQ